MFLLSEQIKRTYGGMNGFKAYDYFTVERRYTNYIVFLWKGKSLNTVNVFILSYIIGEK